MEIINQRMTVDIDSEFVVFLIGMRINKPWKIHRWLPVAASMPRMLNELYLNPESGLISHESWFGRTSIMIQYWRSFEHLEKYARARDAKHYPAWLAFNKKMAGHGDVGIWHETYLSKKGCYECLYHNMPEFGLARLGRHIPAVGKYRSAIDRLGRKRANTRPG